MGNIYVLFMCRFYLTLLGKEIVSLDCVRIVASIVSNRQKVFSLLSGYAQNYVLKFMMCNDAMGSDFQRIKCEIRSAHTICHVYNFISIFSLLWGTCFGNMTKGMK